MNRPTWDEFYLKVADLVASRSKDKSTKIGAVLVKDNAIISVGYNGFPRGLDDDVLARHERPAKYMYTEHAERNAIYNAARSGVKTLGATMYTQTLPCADCSRAAIQAGIERVVAHFEAGDDHMPAWKESCAVGKEMLIESGVEVTLVKPREV